MMDFMNSTNDGFLRLIFLCLVLGVVASLMFYSDGTGILYFVLFACTSLLLLGICVATNAIVKAIAEKKEGKEEK